MTTPASAQPGEAELAQRAAAGDGDGDAFAVLYERYERRAYNLCLRIVGSEHDAADATQEAFLSVLRRLPKLEGRDLAFGSYLFTSARNACYDQLQRAKRAEPSDAIAEGATPVGSATGGGGIGFDPGDPSDDPERNVLQEARTEEIRVANASLPERQREVLALRELEDMSYDDIAAIMDMNRNSVAQMISRARINLRDALRGTAIAAIAASSPECERALPLIAARDDGQLAGADEAWLADHLRACETCALSVEAMAEAGASYRAWVPVAAAPLLLRETLARAAELTGSDWSDAIARAEAARAASDARRSGLTRGPGRWLAGLLPHRRVDLALASAAAVVLLLVILVGSVGDGEPAEELAPAADEAPVTKATPPPDPPRTEKAEKAKEPKKAAQPEANPTPETAPADVAADDAVSPIGDEPASVGPRPRRRSQAIDRDGARERGGSGLKGDQPATTAPAPETTPQPPQTTPEPPPTTTTPPTRTTPEPPPPPRTCRDPLTGRPIPCPQP